MPPTLENPMHAKVALSPCRGAGARDGRPEGERGRLSKEVG